MRADTGMVYHISITCFLHWVAFLPCISISIFFLSCFRLASGLLIPVSCILFYKNTLYHTNLHHGIVLYFKHGIREREMSGNTSRIVR